MPRPGCDTECGICPLELVVEDWRLSWDICDEVSASSITFSEIVLLYGRGTDTVGESL